MEKIQTENIALVGDQIVGDAEASHRFEMSTHDAACNEPSEIRTVALSGFQLVQRLPAEF